MFKNISCLENKKRKILKSFITNRGVLCLDTNDSDIAYILHECIEENYLDNINDWKDSIGNYHFNILGKEIRVTSEGLKFIKNTSTANILKVNFFNLIKGIWGFIIGVISGVIIEYIVWKLGLHS